MIDILIVDDHDLIREGLKKVIAREDDLRVVGEGRHSRDVMGLLEEGADVLILDINLPGRNGLDVLQDSRYAYPEVPVLILSIHAEDQYALHALRMGAAGYVNKSVAASELITAIREVVAGRRYISAAVSQLLAKAIAEDDGDEHPHEALSPRELQILGLIGQGRTISEVAVQLALSPSTVNTYRNRILKKLDRSTTPQLIRYAVEHRIGPDFE